MESQPVVTKPWADKALWLVVLTPLFMFLNSRLGLSLNAEEIAGLILPVVVYIAGHKYKTAKLQAALIAGDKATELVKTDREAAAVLMGIIKKGQQ